MRARRMVGRVMVRCRAGGSVSMVDRVISATIGALLVVLGLIILCNVADPDFQLFSGRS